MSAVKRAWSPLFATIAKLNNYRFIITRSLTPMFPLEISTRIMVKSDLLTGWRPHYAQEGDISVQRSGDDPEVLQMHSGFIQAAGLIQQGRPSHPRLLPGHIEDAKHSWLTSPHDHYVLQVKLICSGWRPFLPVLCTVLLHIEPSFWCSIQAHQACNYHCEGRSL